MAFIIKVLSLLTTIATTLFLTVEGIKRGLLIVSTVFGLVKFLVMIIFIGLLLMILYFLFQPGTSRSESQ
ncbi:MAG: hypothetical protein IPG76_09835 [Acidobacteria bacterium]|nr:hypothetical protein [Acidobacteriota bacterium]MBK9706452.1 hypothetical protein [Acidobacteriota bacterium]